MGTELAKKAKARADEKTSIMNEMKAAQLLLDEGTAEMNKEIAKPKSFQATLRVSAMKVTAAKEKLAELERRINVL